MLWVDGEGKERGCDCVERVGHEEIGETFLKADGCS